MPRPPLEAKMSRPNCVCSSARACSCSGCVSVRGSASTAACAQARAAATQHRDHVPDNLGYGEVGIYRRQPRRADAAHRRAVRGGHAADELQRRDVLHAVARGAAHRALRRAVRHARLHAALARHDAVGDTLAELLEPLGYPSALFGKWHWAMPAGARRPIKASTSGTAFRDSSNESQRSTMNDTPLHLGGQGAGSRRGR